MNKLYSAHHTTSDVSFLHERSSEEEKPHHDSLKSANRCRQEDVRKSNVQFIDLEPAKSS